MTNYLNYTSDNMYDYNILISFLGVAFFIKFFFNLLTRLESD